MKILSERHTKTVKETCISFLDETGDSGFSFPIKDGKPVLLTEAARKNYDDCISGKHPELTRRMETRRHCYKVPAIGLCECGNKVPLVDEYMGACSCKKCGRWYNIFGQSLKNPSHWEDEF